MGRKFGIPLWIIIIIIILGIRGCCNSWSLESDITKLKTEQESILADKDDEIERNKTEIVSLSNQNVTLTKQFQEYKDKMSKYENLAEEEIQVRRIEAQAALEEERLRQEELEKQKAEEEAKAKEEAEKKEKLGYETGYSYNDLARNPDNYINEKVKFKGKVIQLVEGTAGLFSDGKTNAIRLATKGGYDDIIYCQYDKTIMTERVLEDDTIVIYGTFTGLYSYTSILGSKVTLPEVKIDKIEIIK